MSEPHILEDEEAPVVERKPIPGSLEARVAARHEELGKRTTDLFDVPGYEGIFKVELQYLGGKRQYNLGLAHENVHDDYQRGLRTASDMILAATVGFHSVIDEEGNTSPAEGCTWKRLAGAADKHLDVDTVKGRVALQRLLGEEGVLALAAEWKTWMRTRGVKVERQVQADF